MGRPLKIAKAQAVLTITATTAATGLVTVTETLSAPTNGVTSSSAEGIIANMPFVVATNVGGLVAGTVYWVLAVVNAHNFTVSATALSANPTSTPVTLSDTTAQSVKATVAFTDAYFNNPRGGVGYPTTNANTYSVVGGNTAIYGKQVLANVAIGKNGVGTIYGISGNANIIGQGTDFANNVATGTVLQIAVANINGTETNYTTVGFASATHTNRLVVVANTTATGNVIGTSGNAQTLQLNAPVTVDSTFGGLTAGTTYFVKTIPNAAAFTVSATLGGAPKQLTSNVSVTGNAIQNVVVLNAASPVTFSNNAFIQATAEAGFIVRQKGKTKYLVQGATTGLRAQCYTANVANTALTPNTMTITATYANSQTAKIQNLSDHNAEVFDYITAGSFVTGATYTIVSVGTTDFTAIGASANVPGVKFTATGSGSGTGTANYVTGITTTAGSFTTGAVYTILTLGTTSWTGIGASSNAVGVTFTATGAGSGTGTAALNQYPLVIASFNTAYAANTYPTAQPMPIVTIGNA